VLLQLGFALSPAGAFGSGSWFLPDEVGGEALVLVWVMFLDVSEEVGNTAVSLRPRHNTLDPVTFAHTGGKVAVQVIKQIKGKGIDFAAAKGGGKHLANLGKVVGWHGASMSDYGLPLFCQKEGTRARDGAYRQSKNRMEQSQQKRKYIT
jgi:hypothetical protein